MCRRLQDTQCQRALRALAIALICAYSPQAKGCIERANQSLGDCLMSIEATRFDDAYRPLYQSAEDLEAILLVQKIRKLSL